MPRIFGPMVKPGVSFSTTKRGVACRRVAGEQGDAEGHVGAGVGDERLAAVDHPAAVAPLGPGADAPGVGAGVGLGEAERAERPALGERPQPALALLVVAEQQQRQRADGDVGLPRGGDRLVGQAELLHGGDEAHRRHADAAPLLGDEHAEQAELAHLAQQVGGADGVLPRLGRPGGDLLLGEVAAQADQVALGFRQGEVHAVRYTDRYKNGFRGRLATPWTCWSSGPGSPASTSSSGRWRRASPHGSSRPGRASAAPGTGTATPAAGSTPRATPTPTSSRRTSSTSGSGRSTSPPSPRPSAYLNHVVDRFDLRRHIRFGTRVTAADWDDATGTWLVATDDGTEQRARFVVAATGVLSVPYFPEVRGPRGLRRGAGATPAGGPPSRSTSPASESPSSAPARAACRSSRPSSTRSPRSPSTSAPPTGARR